MVATQEWEGRVNVKPMNASGNRKLSTYLQCHVFIVSYSFSFDTISVFTADLLAGGGPAPARRWLASPPLSSSSITEIYDPENHQDINSFMRLRLELTILSTLHLVIHGARLAGGYSDRDKSCIWFL